MSWKEMLAGDMPADWAREIDVFETQLELKKQGKLTDQLFAETRLRRGAYGQRYDNGQRNDGTGTKTLPYDSQLTKGPETLFHAPGMQRIKIPFGGMNPKQMEVLADLCEEYSDNICHVTTRQDFQLHYIHIDDCPDIMRRLAAVGITTREACGNSVRNVTGCPLAGVCRDEQFDISPYADAMMHFMLGHPDTMEFGRKFKIAFSGCAQHACGLLNMHDLGLLAVTKTEDGVEKRGFTMYVGGGLGAVPHNAKVLEEFVTEDELLPISQAIARVFARLGEKRNRARARIKFLIKSLGIDEFRRLVREERTKLPHDPRWTSYIPKVAEWHETPIKSGAALNGAAQPDGFATWHAQNVIASARRATSSPPSRCRSATSPPTRCAPSPTSSASTSATPSARRSIRTSSCAGCARPTCPTSTATSPPSSSERPAPRPSSTSRRAPAPTPASSASPRRAVSRASCAIA
jgi:sulfite reductase (ferredoxin)